MKIKEFQLYKGCKENNSNIQFEVFNRYLKRFIAICERYVNTNEDAQDIVQESFITIFNKIDLFNWKGDGSFEKWMHRIVTNRAVNHYQKYKTKQYISLENTDDVIDDEYEYIEILGYKELIPEHLNTYDIPDNELLETLKMLPENFRVVFNMYVVDDFSHKEIAKELKISEKTSTTRLHRARKLLQKHLANRIKERDFVYEK